jgi:hypothetical protein
MNDGAWALLRAVATALDEAGVEMSLDAARTSAYATSRKA